MHAALHDWIRAVFLRSLELARERGLLRNKHLRLVLDTTPSLRRGAVKDTYNLLADSIRQLLRMMAKVQAEIVADAERLLGQALTSLQAADREDPARPQIMAAAELLCKGLLQDIDRRPDGVALRERVAKDRSASVHDPEGAMAARVANSASTANKAALAVEAESQLITAVVVLSSNAPDAQGPLTLVAESEHRLVGLVAETVVDAAYGDGDTRRQFAEAKRTFIAKVPRPPRSARFTKQDFHIDPEVGRCTCPAGEATTRLHSQGRDREGHRKRVPRQAFVFEGAVCDGCRLRPQCVKAKPGRGRSVSLHPQEDLLQEARALQASAAFAPYRVLRQVAEHRWARLVQLGLRQARYRGRLKTEVQLLLAATVANLTCLWAATRETPQVLCPGT